MVSGKDETPVYNRKLKMGMVGGGTVPSSVSCIAGRPLSTAALI